MRWIIIPVIFNLKRFFDEKRQTVRIIGRTKKSRGLIPINCLKKNGLLNSFAFGQNKNIHLMFMTKCHEIIGEIFLAEIPK
jgi:hypothetical protein